MSFHESMVVVTHFGAVALLGPFSLAIALWLALRAGRREALLWCACVAGVGLAMALLKIWFGTCHVRWFDVHSPSGHTAAAAIGYGGFTVIAMAGSSSLRAALFRVGTVIWVVLIGFSRVEVHAHTPGEVLAGLAVGAVAVTVFASLYQGRVRPPYLLAGGMIAAVWAVALWMPVGSFTLELWLGHVARLLQPYQGLLCG